LALRQQPLISPDSAHQLLDLLSRLDRGRRGLRSLLLRLCPKIPVTGGE
jgi:hypothetical protein